MFKEKSYCQIIFLLKRKIYNCVKNDSIRISAFYYHRKDTLPCELVYVDDEVSIDEVYSIRNEGMYNIPKEYNDYQFPKSEIVRFVVRGINPRETKKWIKFEQCRCICIKVHYHV